MKSEQILYFHVIKNLLSTYYMPATLIGGRDTRKDALVVLLARWDTDMKIHKELPYCMRRVLRNSGTGIKPRRREGLSGKQC